MEQEVQGSPKISQEVFNSYLEVIKLEGKHYFPDFKIEKEQEEYYVNLYLYFLGLDSCPYNLKKGLLICGNVGTGKTMSMKLMQKMCKGFQIINTRYLVREFIESGVKIFDDYGRGSFMKTPTGSNDYKRPTIKCFDDFGLENVNAKMFGNQQNVMEEIILDRYDMFVGYGMKTFATTNLSPELIEQTYGERVRDRLREMMNYITLTGKSKRN